MANAKFVYLVKTNITGRSWLPRSGNTSKAQAKRELKEARKAARRLGYSFEHRIVRYKRDGEL